MELKVLTVGGKDSGTTVRLAETVFAIEPSDHAMYLDVKQFLANGRQGTHKAKERNEIAGSTRKLHKQKGTGGSRKGSIKNPLFRGGGRIFGPQPRDYSFKLNKKLKNLARKSALTYKAREHAVVVLEDFAFEHVKTKDFTALLQNLNLHEKTLILTANIDKKLLLSSRNVQHAKVLKASDLNTYDIMHASKLVLTASSIKIVEEALNRA